MVIAQALLKHTRIFLGWGGETCCGDQTDWRLPNRFVAARDFGDLNLLRLCKGGDKRRSTSGRRFCIQ